MDPNNSVIKSLWCIKPYINSHKTSESISICNYLKGKNLLPKGVNPFSEGRQRNFDRVTIPECLSIPLKLLLNVLTSFSYHRELQVVVGKQVKCNLGNKARQLAVKPTATNGGPVFKKDGDILALMWPS